MMLFPYVKIDNEWTVPAGLMAALWKEMERDGVDKTTFYDGSVQTAEQFIQYMQSGAVLPVVWLERTGPEAIAWLSDVNTSRAFVHFCMLKRTWGRTSRDIAEQIVRYWWSLRGSAGPLFQLLLGLTPAWNKQAVRFGEKLGFNRVGEVPRICKGKSGQIAGVLMYQERPEDGR